MTVTVWWSAHKNLIRQFLLLNAFLLNVNSQKKREEKVEK